MITKEWTKNGDKYSTEVVTFEGSAPAELQKISKEYDDKFKDFIINKCFKTANHERCSKCYYFTLDREDHKGCLNVVAYNDYKYKHNI